MENKYLVFANLTELTSFNKIQSKVEIICIRMLIEDIKKNKMENFNENYNN